MAINSEGHTAVGLGRPRPLKPGWFSPAALVHRVVAGVGTGFWLGRVDLLRVSLWLSLLYFLFKA